MTVQLIVKDNNLTKPVLPHGIHESKIIIGFHKAPFSQYFTLQDY